MRYYISDQHFYHDNLNRCMDCRGFESGEAMNEYMISRWNSRVRPKDEVVILGDFCISPKGEDANAVLARLNGRKYLVVGNHDKYLNSKEFDAGHFQWITPYRELKDQKRKVILSHYPIMCYNGQYRRDSGTPRHFFRLQPMVTAWFLMVAGCLDSPVEEMCSWAVHPKTPHPHKAL